MKVKLRMNCGYVGTEAEEEIEVDDDITEEGLEELAEEFFWDNFGGSYSYEIIEGERKSKVRGEFRLAYIFSF